MDHVRSHLQLLCPSVLCLLLRQVRWMILHRQKAQDPLAPNSVSLCSTQGLHLLMLRPVGS